MNYLTVNETAQLLRVSPITIRRYIASGRLEAERVGRGIRVRREAIDRFISPAVPVTCKTSGRREEALPINREVWGGSIGIDRAVEPTSMVERKEDRVTEADLESDSDHDDGESDDLLGKPFTFDDPLWNIMGIGSSDDSTDVATDTHKYLADAILADKG